MFIKYFLFFSIVLRFNSFSKFNVNKFFNITIRNYW
jgi:hypothetical protein